MSAEEYEVSFVVRFLDGRAEGGWNHQALFDAIKDCLAGANTETIIEVACKRLNPPRPQWRSGRPTWIESIAAEPESR